MKNYLFILFILTFNFNLYSQWADIAPENMSELFEYQAIDINTIYLTYGTLAPNAKHYTVRTLNAGQTWDTISNYLYDFYFFSKDTGIYLYKRNTYRTNDGCKTFSKTSTLYAPTPGMAFLTKNKFNGNLFMYSNDSGLVKSTDTGRTWKKLTQSVAGLQFPTPNVGYGYGKGSTHKFTSFYKTTDGGNNWQLVQEFNNAIRTIRFVSKDVGYMTRYYTYYGHDSIFKTTDGGVNWTAVMNGINDVQGVLNERLYDMYFANENIGWVNLISSGKNYIYKTTDGGKWWQKLAFENFSCAVAKFKGFDSNNILLFPFDCAYITNCLYRTTNGGGENSSIFETNNSKINKDYTIYPNPTKSTITIECRNKNKMTTKVKIYDIQGKLIKEQQLTLDKTVIDIKDFSKGIYFVKIKDGDGVFVEKVVKN
ncbi:MAG: T9SS type A sorting domain-containing protein [Bacteroidota bacterium]|nr:T9SS type A sorting domain-containing protein [Bacteroidota bacterium]